MNDMLDKLLKCRTELFAEGLEEAELGFRGLYFRQEAELTGRRILGRLESMENETRLRSVFGSNMRRLVQLCDELFEKGGAEVEDPNVLAVLEVIGGIKQAFPHLVDRSLALPKAFRKIHALRFRVEWEEIVLGWKPYGFDGELLVMAELPLALFESLGSKLSWFHYTWLKNYFSQVKMLDLDHSAPYPSPDHLVRELLIRLNFNHDRFSGYCFRVIGAAVDAHTDQEDQLFVLGLTAKLVAQMGCNVATPFVEDGTAVAEHILNWVKQEEGFREKYDPDFFKVTGEKAPVNPWKFHYHKFNGEQVSFWHKMQMDHDLLPVEPIETFAKRISYNCSTGSKEHVAYTTFLAKLYSKDIDVVAPIYELVESIIKFLEPILQKLMGMKTELAPFVKYKG